MTATNDAISSPTAATSSAMLRIRERDFQEATGKRSRFRLSSGCGAEIELFVLLRPEQVKVVIHVFKEILVVRPLAAMRF